MIKKGQTTKNVRPWCDAEIARFKMLYPIRHNTELVRLFSRSVNAIKKKARKLRLEKDFEGGYRYARPEPENAWTEKEIKHLKHQYSTKTIEEIAETLDRTPAAIQSKAGMLGLKKSVRWTAEEVTYITEHYAEYGGEYIARKLGRTPRAIFQKARKLGLSDKGAYVKPWTRKEEAFIKRVYFEWSLEEISEELDRAVSTIRAHALKLGLIKQPRWTKEEENQLKRLYAAHTFKEIAEIIDRPLEAVKGKSRRMKLHKL